MTTMLELTLPSGVTFSTAACRAYMDGGWPDGLTKEVDRALDKLEKAMGKHLGDPGDPLLVSVRSGAKFSMPGMMDTVLNLGLNGDLEQDRILTERVTECRCAVRVDDTSSHRKDVGHQRQSRW